MRKLLVLIGMACLIAVISCSKKKSTEPEDQDFVTDNSLRILREYWTKASPPQGQTDSTRSRLIWYNPFHDFYYIDIYDTVLHNQDLKVKVLVIQFSPTSPESWGGIMRAMSRCTSDQSTAGYLEARIGTYGDVPGVLHLELGEISEDIDGDGILDSEDRELRDEDGLALRMKNGILDDGEDTGLDSLFSSQEPGYDRVSNPDPSGDDWHYDENDPENYEGINGTENNAGGDLYGVRPDTEDIDGDCYLDFRNLYYSFSIDLLDSPFLVAGSEHVADRISPDLVFRTYRIPLWEQSNDPQFGTGGDSDNIRYVRMWLGGMTEQKQVVIADLDLVPQLY